MLNGSTRESAALRGLDNNVKNVDVSFRQILPLLEKHNCVKLTEQVKFEFFVIITILKSTIYFV